MLVKDVGMGQFFTTSIFYESTQIPLIDVMWSKNTIDTSLKLQFENLAYSSLSWESTE